MIRKSLAVAALLLVAFHGWLFADQLWNGQIADAALVARWLVAAGLLFALRQLRQRGASIFRGRKAIAIWLLAAVLHGPALAEEAGLETPAMPGVVAALAPVAASTVLAGLFVLLLLASGTRRRINQPIRSGFVFDAFRSGPLALVSHAPSLPRPPPTPQI